jgi:flagellum-specific ATP synthase
LSRQLGHQGQYPAIDALKSASRLLPELASAEDRATVHQAIRVMALLERNRQMVELGAYEAGANPQLDAALACQATLQDWLRQSEGGVPRADSMAALRNWAAAMARASAAASMPTGATPQADAERSRARPANAAAKVSPTGVTGGPSTPARGRRS